MSDFYYTLPEEPSDSWENGSHNWRRSGPTNKQTNKHCFTIQKPSD